MAHYLVSITRYAPNGEPETRVRVECHTGYTLTRDLPDWIKEEIDPIAVVEYDTLFTEGKDE